MAQEIGRPTRVLPEAPDYSELRQKIEDLGGIRSWRRWPVRKKRPASRHGPGAAGDSGGPGSEVEGREKVANGLISEVKKKLVRNVMLTEQRRIDGRGFGDVRIITGKSAC